MPRCIQCGVPAKRSLQWLAKKTAEKGKLLEACLHTCVERLEALAACLDEADSQVHEDPVPSIDWSANGTPFVDPEAEEESIANTTSYSHEWSQPLALQVSLLSGSKLASLDATSNWTGLDAKDALVPYLRKGTAVTKLTFGTQIWEDTMIADQLCIPSGSLLYATLGAYEFSVAGAGAALVNGIYMKCDHQKEGADCYMNASGTTLFRYRFGNGVHYWYFSREGDLTKSFGDYYRVKTESIHPPADGWVMQDKCPLGCLPTPCLTRGMLAEDQR